MTRQKQHCTTYADQDEEVLQKNKKQLRYYCKKGQIPDEIREKWQTLSDFKVHKLKSTKTSYADRYA